ncbi:hypothetical protein N9D38_11940 [Rubripirellula sp.]|nr:hypothetical protein [Rubripirellula sp.]
MHGGCKWISINTVQPHYQYGAAALSIRCSRTTGPLTTKARVASGGSGSGESSVGELSLPTKHLLRSNLDPHYRGHAILELPDVTSSR